MLITLARKPLDGTVAGNVLRWGTGGLNVDGCRVGTEERPQMVRTATVVAATSMSNTSTGATSSGEVTTQGRWPANVLHDGSPEVLAGFPQTNSHGGGTSSTGFWQRDDRKQPIGSGDSGSAARFFKQIGTQRQPDGLPSQDKQINKDDTP